MRSEASISPGLECSLLSSMDVAVLFGWSMVNILNPFGGQPMYLVSIKSFLLTLVLSSLCCGVSKPTNVYRLTTEKGCRSCWPEMCQNLVEACACASGSRRLEVSQQPRKVGGADGSHHPANRSLAKTADMRSFTLVPILADASSGCRNQRVVVGSPRSSQ